MADQRDAELHRRHGAHGHGSARSYLVGFLLSAALTAVPFWLVISGALTSPGLTAGIVIACAAVQIVVHAICFLHVDTRSEGGWTLMTFVFTAVIVLITIGGSVWIMYHMNTNMMPMEAIGR